MRHRLLNLATLLSLLLTLAAGAMWLRSRYVSEGWESKPRPSGMTFAGSGYHSMWAMESSNGRLLYVSHKILIQPPAAPPARRRGPGYHPVPAPAITLFPGGYYRTYSGIDAITPLRHNRRFPVYSRRHADYAVHTYGRIPFVVEWCEKSAYDWSPPGKYVAVPWLTIAFGGLIIPGIRAGLRRWQVLSRPGFPLRTVIAVPAAATSTSPASAPDDGRAPVSGAPISS